MTVANCDGHANDAGSFDGFLRLLTRHRRVRTTGDGTFVSSAVRPVSSAPWAIRPEATGWVTSIVVRGTIG